ncbi:inner centromere protein A isoform X1 [Pelmatolapia mariae]|uniref:inner centromere protein A isoform X1 n=1 Tax=Pelmatolapia mariae TaxID=158779 RepID=UPI002FE50C8A
MNSVLSVRSLTQMFGGKAQDIINEIDNVHMVWLEEIQQEANRMFSRDFNAEPELMPKTPSQKKNSRRKRVSLGRQEENQGKQRYSKGRRSNLRGSSVRSLQFIAKEDPISEASTSEASSTGQSKRTTRRNKQTKPELVDDESQSPHDSDKAEEVQNKTPMLEEVVVDKNKEVNDAKVKPDDAVGKATSPESLKIPLPEAIVSISHVERLSAELAKEPEPSPGRTAAKIAIAESAQTSRRSSVQCSLKLRHSLAGLRHSMTQESVRRASRRSMLKRKATRVGNSTCSTKVSDDSCVEDEEEMEKENQEVLSEAVSVDNAGPQGTPEGIQQSLVRITRSVAANSPKLAPPSLFISEMKMSTPSRAIATEKLNLLPVRRSSRSTKRKAPDTIDESPTKRCSPPKKSQSAIKPHMKSFLHTVQKNQMLMMTPNSVGRTAVIKSFIKHNTPLRVDPKFNTSIVTKERNKLEALKKKQEQEEERMRKMEEEKKRKQEELKRKRDERLRRVFEAKVKEEQREEEKKKKIEQKMAQIDEKNDKRMAEEKAKKKAALKRQEELEQKRKMEEEARKKKIQQEEEKRQQELLAKKKAEEEARKALELKREQERERERELERELQAAAERERVEKEKALALQREVERAAREKEMRELEEKRKALEEKRKLEEQQRLAAKEKAAKELEAAKKLEADKQRDAAAQEAAKTQTAANLNVTVDIERSVMSTPVGKGGLNVTVDIEHSSPQSYAITPKGGDKPLILSKDPEDYGMDQNSDDSTDDESAPRKPIPSWAEGPNLQQIIMKQYFNPPDLDSFFGPIEPPRLENIFYKSKPRYFKRTSSAVWHSPPAGN